MSPAANSVRVTLLMAAALLPLVAAVPKDLNQVIDQMTPYTGPHNPGVDTSTLTGKVMCGYQGWFAAPGDGSERGWVHWNLGKKFEPGHCSIDLWPDMSEMDADEKFDTPFKYADGSEAKVFSSYNKKTVVRHFKWMKEHDIDGAFLQRFATSLRHPVGLNHRNVVTHNVQAGANEHGRAWAMMYDLSGLKIGEIDSILIKDWKNLVDRMKILEDKSYLHHEGKPLIAVWGIGFQDRESRENNYTLEECDRLIKFLKDDPKYGGLSIMLGVPSWWRTQERDSTRDPKLHAVLKQADVLSGWTPGRYRTPEQAAKHAAEVVAPDIAWTTKESMDYLPVAFPGFSWYNLKHRTLPNATLNHIPRLKGNFLWSQIRAYREAGAEMLYVAMFDEVDEGTAIFKCTNNPPVGDSPFSDYEGLPSDHYLWLTGMAGKVMSGKIKATEAIPKR